MDNKILKEIEGSEEYKNSLKDNVEEDVDYDNAIANRISNVATIVLIVGIILGILQVLSLTSTHEEIVPIIISCGTTIAIFFVGYIVLKGFAEIIELLQKIKNK